MRSYSSVITANGRSVSFLNTELKSAPLSPPVASVVRHGLLQRVRFVE